MPREGKIKRQKRAAVRQTDTFEYGVGIDPAARPVQVNTSVTPQNQGDRLNTFLMMLDNIKSGIKSGVTILDQYQKRQEKEGGLSETRGEPLDKDANDAFIKGYEKMKGAGEGYNQLLQVLQEHFNEHSQEDPLAFERSQDQVISEFMGGRSDAFLEGIMPGASRLQKDYEKQFVNQKQEEFHIDKLTTTRGLLRAELDKINKDIGDPEEKAKAIRGLLSELQFLGDAALSLTKQEVSEQLVSLLNEEAFATADSSRLDMAFLQGPDGVRLIDNPTLAKAISAGRKAADNEFSRRESEKVKKIDRLVKDIESDITSDISELMRIAGSPEAKPEARAKAVRNVNELLYKFGDRGRNKAGIELDYKVIEHFQNEIRETAGESGVYAKVSNLDIQEQAYELAKTEPMALSPAYMDAIKPFLERIDYEEIFKAKAATMATRKNVGHKKSVKETRWDTSRKNLMSVLGKQDKIFGSLYDNGDERIRLGNTLAFNAWDLWIRENKGRQPGVSEQYDILSAIKKQVDDLLPAVPREGLPGAGQEAAANAITGSALKTIKPEDSDIESRFDDLIKTPSINEKVSKAVGE